MKTKKYEAGLILLTLLTFSLYASPLFAHCLEPYDSDHSGGGSVSISVENKNTDLESTDQYLSGPAGTEDWQVVHDVDGSLNGFAIKARPPILGKRIKLDLTYMTGDLDGTFSTQELSPTPEGPYSGTVEFDRDEWKLGADVFILNALYARLEYFTYEMDGDWVYTDGSPNEPQKYEFDAYSIGVGFTQNLGLAEGLKSKKPNAVFEGGFDLIVDVFTGFTFWELKHKEVLTGASVETDGIGYKLRAELIGAYGFTLTPHTQGFAFVGVGYNYENSDDDNVDLTNKDITYKLGFNIIF